MDSKKILVFGGNGFVGCAIAQALVEQNSSPVCISRTGSRPAHLLDAQWADQVEWIQGDANDPNPELFEGVDAVVALIGSPPVPTFSKAAYESQLQQNSAPNLAVIEAAKKAGVSRLVAMGAHLPSLLNTDRFGYAKGKQLCLQAARQFAEYSDQHSAVVLQPSAIYGVRHTSSGKAINLKLVMKPIAQLQGIMPDFIKAVMPEQLVPVEAVARAVVDACLGERYSNGFSIISNQQMIQQYA